MKKMFILLSASLIALQPALVSAATKTDEKALEKANKKQFALLSKEIKQDVSSGKINADDGTLLQTQLDQIKEKKKLTTEQVKVDLEGIKNALKADIEKKNSSVPADQKI